MPYDFNKMNKWSQGNADKCNQMWNYTDLTSTLATIIANGFFNDVNINPANPVMNIGDQIWIVCSDVPNGVFYVVTAIDPNIVVGSYSANGSSYQKVTLSSAQFLGMYAAPALLLPAPAAGLAILVDKLLLDMTFVTTQYAGGGAINGQYGNTIHGGGINCCGTDTIAAATVNGWAASSGAEMLGRVPVAGAANANFVAQGIYLSNATGAFTTGDGTFDVHLFYSIVTI